MENFSTTYIIRHARENLKKCSLAPLERTQENLEKFIFFTYPCCVQGKEVLPCFDNHVILDIEGEPLSERDATKGIILIDATWRLACKMLKNIPQLAPLPRRSFPKGFKTAYPRRQLDCPDVESGLASIEALYIAFALLGRPVEFLLDGYIWKEQFLEKNTFQLINKTATIY